MVTESSHDLENVPVPRQPVPSETRIKPRKKYGNSSIERGIG